jgi:hypothetical protein
MCAPRLTCVFRNGLENSYPDRSRAARASRTPPTPSRTSTSPSACALDILSARVRRTACVDAVQHGSKEERRGVARRVRRVIAAVVEAFPVCRAVPDRVDREVRHARWCRSPCGRATPSCGVPATTRGAKRCRDGCGRACRRSPPRRRDGHHRCAAWYFEPNRPRSSAPCHTKSAERPPGC